MKEYTFTENWFSYIVKGVINPSRYVQGDQFSLLYLKGTGVVQWEFVDQLKYYIGGQPSLVKMKEIEVSKDDVKTLSDYKFKIEKNSNFDYVPSLGISITLP